MAKKDDNQKKSLIINPSYAKIYLELEPAISIIGDMKGIKDIEVTINIVKTRKNIDSVLDTFNKARTKIIEDNAEKEKDGKFATRKGLRMDFRTGKEVEAELYVFKDKETEKQVNIQLQQLDAKEVELEIFPINYLTIKDCEDLTPNILKAAGDFVKL